MSVSLFDMASLLRWIFRRGKTAMSGSAIELSDEAKVRKLRARGVRIGAGCRIYTTEFSTEPYLVTLGNGVLVAGGVKFLTHDGSARLLRSRRPRIQAFGRIVVGDDSFIGENSILLMGTTIGARCIVAAGSVVRGAIPDNSLVAGNPARIFGRASVYLERLASRPNSLDTFGLVEPERRAIIASHFQIGAEGLGPGTH